MKIRATVTFDFEANEIYRDLESVFTQIAAIARMDTISNLRMHREVKYAVRVENSVTGANFQRTFAGEQWGQSRIQRGSTEMTISHSPRLETDPRAVICSNHNVQIYPGQICPECYKLIEQK